MTHEFLDAYGNKLMDSFKQLKHKKETKYSEEEVFKLLMDFWMDDKAEYKMNPVCVSNWFEKFKKK